MCLSVTDPKPCKTEFFHNPPLQTQVKQTICLHNNELNCRSSTTHCPATVEKKRASMQPHKMQFVLKTQIFLCAAGSDAPGQLPNSVTLCTTLQTDRSTPSIDQKHLTRCLNMLQTNVARQANSKKRCAQAKRFAFACFPTSFLSCIVLVKIQLCQREW